MTNDTIGNAQNCSDWLCNGVIRWSNDLADDLGLTYGELWAGITIIVIFIIALFNVMLLLSLYCPKAKKAIRYAYWMINGLIVLIVFLILMIPVTSIAESE